MTDQPSTPDPLPTDPPADPAAWAQGVLRRQVALLEHLAEAGLRLALTIERRAAEPSSDSSSVASAKEEVSVKAGDLAMAFSRVARAVRMTALLQSRLLRDMDEARSRGALARLREAALGEGDDEAARQDPAYAHKARVEAIVARVARAGGPDRDGQDEDRIERLVRETGERLDDDDIYGDVLARPVGELVSLICRDLGLDPDWTRLAEEAWAQEEIENSPPGSPFSELALARPPFFAAAKGGGGPSAERSEELMVEGAGQAHPPATAQSNPPRVRPPPPPLRGPPPPLSAREVVGRDHENAGHHP